ncbi:MAG: hypothetical protein M1482_13525 [Chloroflexi bacterium]|nr:hypothetical protein [Chloroflexota bacterium]
MSSSEGQIGRVVRSREQARATYDRISRWYDPLEGNWERKSKELGLRMLGTAAGQVVLEIGFGTGHGIESLARAVGPSGRVYGVDLSPRWLR